MIRVGDQLCRDLSAAIGSVCHIQCLHAEVGSCFWGWHGSVSVGVLRLLAGVTQAETLFSGPCEMCENAWIFLHSKGVPSEPLHAVTQPLLMPEHFQDSCFSDQEDCTGLFSVTASSTGIG